MKKIFLLLTVYAHFSVAQDIFQKTIGGTRDDLANAVQQTSDGGYILTGETGSFGVGDRDVYFVKVNDKGEVVYSRTYGGSAADYALTLDQMTDGNYLIGAHTASFGQGGHDYFLVKTNTLGDTLFTRLYGGSAPDGIYQLKQGVAGIVMAGHTSSYGAGAHDFYAIKILESGSVVWTKTFGGSGSDQLRAFTHIEEFVDIPRLALVGETSGFGAGANDILFVKTNMDGELQFAKTYGNTGNDFGYSILETQDGGFLIAGHTNSSGAGSYDVQLVKTNFSGNVEWTKTYGGSENDYCFSAQRTLDGGYILIGSTSSFGGGSSDIYVIKTAANGDLTWAKTYGGLMADVGRSIQQTEDGGYVFAGSTSSFGAGQKDIYLIKTDANGTSGCNEFSTNTVVGSGTIVTSTPNLTIGSGAISSSSPTIVTDPPAQDSYSCDPLGTGKLENRINVFPNPFRESITLEFNYESGEFMFRIYTLTGKLVKEIEKIRSGQVVIEKGNLSDGMYIFHLRRNHQIVGIGKLVAE